MSIIIPTHFSLPHIYISKSKHIAQYIKIQILSQIPIVFRESRKKSCRNKIRVKGSIVLKNSENNVNNFGSTNNNHIIFRMFF